ncbi:MAG: serine hydrolase domain-containing protein [Actinomycetota bacterium]
MPRTRIPTAAELGLMEGSPPPPGRLVTLANWQDPPFNRWGFQHVRDLIPTARISRGPGAARRLPRDDRDLAGVTVKSGGRRLSLERLLDETYTDGLLVLHRGRVVTERYFNGMTPSSTHLLMSVSKSITSTVAGVLVRRGSLHADDLVTAHVPELVGTSFDGCTVRHLLDMRAGTRFDENYDDPKADVRVYEQIYLWRPRTGRRLPATITEYYPTLRNARPHGGPFEYRSVLTDVLGWVLERAGGARLADLIARDLWVPMGAESDAEITVDAHGHPMADGGICTTLRDLARFGQLMLDGGRRGNRRIVPSAWIRDTVTADPETRAAFARSEDARELPPRAFYRNQWWVLDPDGPVYQGSGINGQNILVHVPAEVVIAKMSTWPVAWDPSFAVATTNGMIDLARRLGAGVI